MASRTASRTLLELLARNTAPNLTSSSRPAAQNTFTSLSRSAPRTPFVRVPASRSFTTKSSSARRPTSKTSASAFSRIMSRCRSFRARFSTSTGAKADDSSLGARMKKLSREYGWSALGVYLMLSALDFPFCYLLVRYLGTDRIGEWEHIIVSNAKKVIPDSVKDKWTEWRQSMKQAERELTGSEDVSDGVEMAGWGLEEATEQNKKDASLATQLALAYAIHKSFIFIRVPLTAAVTPKVVKVLRGWGWDIGKRTTKAAKAAKRAEKS